MKPRGTRQLMLLLLLLLLRDVMGRRPWVGGRKMVIRMRVLLEMLVLHRTHMMRMMM